MLGFYFLYAKGILVIFVIWGQQNIHDRKQKLQKSLVHKKNFIMKINLKSIMKQQRCTMAILVGAEKKLTKKKNDDVAFT